MFFEKFPLLSYTLDNGTSYQLIPDILRRIKMSNELKRNAAFFDQYDIKDGETPEIVSSLFYGDPNLHWVILMTNDIIDPRFDWPMDYNTLVQFVKGKYGEDAINSVHHYANAAEYVVGGYRGLREESTIKNPLPIIIQDSEGITSSMLLEDADVTLYPVTNLDYEDAINENKRRINILKPSVISEIDDTFTNMIQE